MMAAIVTGTALAVAGAAASYRLKQRVRFLRAWQSALRSMHAACAYARAGSAQILRAGAGKVAMLASLAREVELRGADVERACERLDALKGLREEERAVVLTVMQALSNGGREEQSAALAFALERFAAFCEQSERKRDGDAQMYITLGVLGGLCAFLILC